MTRHPDDAAVIQSIRSRIVASPEQSIDDAVRESMPWQGAQSRARTAVQTHSAIRGAGPLDVLLADPAVTDILVNGATNIWADRGNGLERIDPSEVTFADDEEVRRLAVRLAAASGRRLDPASPFADATLGDGTRVHAVIPPASRSGPCMSLRVLRRRVFGLEDLQRSGSIDPITAATIRTVIAARLAFVITGGTGSGKTTLLGAILGLAAQDERLLIVEDSAELAPNHPHVVSLIARPPNAEGAGEITLRDLVRQALRMRPDRIIVGEVRGPEVVDLLAALNTGHDGGAATVHANAPSELPARLEALASTVLARDALHSQALAALQVVIHVSRTPQGRRVDQLAVVRRTSDHHLDVVPALTAGRADDGYADLVEMLRVKGVTAVVPGIREAVPGTQR